MQQTKDDILATHGETLLKTHQEVKLWHCDVVIVISISHFITPMMAVEQSNLYQVIAFSRVARKLSQFDIWTGITASHLDRCSWYSLILFWEHRKWIFSYSMKNIIIDTWRSAFWLHHVDQPLICTEYVRWVWMVGIRLVYLLKCSYSHRYISLTRIRYVSCHH